MSIYRGEGGAGDATNDVSVNQITAYSIAAQAAAVEAAGSATSATSSASAAASSASAAATSATNAASSASSASTSATTASTQASNAGASATAAASSATAAASSASAASTSATAASTSASAAATSATSASTSASTATTQASNASSSASTAATSATNAATSATTATTQAGNASTSASNASTAASNASTSSTAAASSATDAAASATSAAASAASINDANIVHKTGDETIAGIKSFSNNLNIGQTTSALQSGGTGATLYGTTSSEIKFLNNTTGQTATDGTALVATGNAFTINNRESAGTIVLGTNNTERMRLDSIGNLLVGTTANTNASKVVVAGAVESTSTGFRFPDASTQNTAATGFGFKNRIINGNFSIWQRGNSVTPSLGSLTSYVSDRWASYQTGAATAITKSGGFTGQPNCLSFSGTASNTEVTVFQCIESVNCGDLVGSNITLSVWLYSTVASKAVTLLIDTANTADTFSATTNKASSTVSVPAGVWTQYTLTYSNADASVANGIRVRAAYGACTSGTYALTGVQLEKGSTATTFDYRPYGTELALCQRYYQVLADNSRLSGMAFNASVNPMSWVFGVQMRTTPTTIALSGVGTSTVLCGGSNLPLTSISSAGGSPSGVFFDANTGGGGTAGFGTQLRLVGSTISAGAEL